MPESTKQKRWLFARREVKKISDKLGMPVDKEIVDTVTILRLLGFNTTGSCGGHMRRITRGPYVIIQSPKAMTYASRARAMDVQSTKYRELCRKINYLRAHDLQELTNYLSSFYRDRQLPHYESHLIIHSMPMTMNILQCQGAELAFAASREAKKKILQINRAEMSAFTEYLEKYFFADA